MPLFSKLKRALGLSSLSPSVASSVDQLAREVEGGRLTLSEAAAHGVKFILPHLEFDALRQDNLAQVAQSNNGQWQAAVTYFRILFAILSKERSAARRDALMLETVKCYLYVAAAACTAIPDGRIFNDALERGTEAIRTALEQAETFTASTIIHCLGVLHLDPFCSGRRPADFEQQEREWRGRLVSAYGPATAQSDAAKLPATTEALASAIEFFEIALKIRAGQPRGFTLKALCNAFSWRECLLGVDESERIIACAGEALTLIPDDYHAELLELIITHGGDAPGGEGTSSADQARLLAANPTEMIAKRGVRRTVDEYCVLLSALTDRDPITAIELIARLMRILSASAHRSERSLLEMHLGKICIALATREGARYCPGTEITRQASALVGQASREAWAPARLIGSLAGLALSTQEKDEAAGPAVMDEALEAAERIMPSLVMPLWVLQAILWRGAGVDAYRASQWQVAAQRYMKAVASYFSGGAVEQAFTMLGYAENVAVRDPDVAFSVIEALDLVSVGLALAGPAETPKRLRGLFERLVAHGLGLNGTTCSVDLSRCWIALQAAKGAAFGLGLLRPSAYDWRADPDALRALEAMATLRANIEVSDRFDSGIGDNLLLTSYRSSVAANLSGDQARLQRLEQRFDTRMLQCTAGDGGILAGLLSIDQIRARLTNTMVLMSQFVGIDIRGDRVLMTLLLTRETSRCALQTFGDRVVQTVVEAPGGTAEVGPLSFRVAAARDALTAYTTEQPASREAMEALVEDSGLVVGSFADLLRELARSGKDHLCIHPHDALHFYPQHLLMLDGSPLADHWTVTYVPHPTILQRSNQFPNRRALLPVTSFGLSYAGGIPHRLTELAAAEPEAQAVAAAIGGQSLVGVDATDTALEGAFASSRRIHIACHGALNAAAPAFQALYLQPDRTTDGIFNAYEVIGRDLSHIELVTLSACETALGRFDALDNVRGFSPNLLACGVRAVISCLWPVADDAAYAFFVTLYEEIANGKSTLAAFRSSQIKTRSLLPDYRHWGAFHYSGNF